MRRACYAVFGQRRRATSEHDVGSVALGVERQGELNGRVAQLFDAEKDHVGETITAGTVEADRPRPAPVDQCAARWWGCELVPESGERHARDRDRAVG